MFLAAKRARGKRQYKDPVPRFRPDRCGELDPVWGCLEIQIRADHFAREVKRLVAQLDFSAVTAKASSQGQHGFHPAHVLGALVYASLLGLHFSTHVARALETDAALRFVAGGHRMSEGTLRVFRRVHRALFEELLVQTVRLAHEAGLVDASQLALDSVRLRAEASTKAVRTLKRSTQRLEELARVDVAALDEEERAAHALKVVKHTEALRLCREHQRSNYVLTSPLAGLQAFPDGAVAPGHRVTVMGCGVSERIVIDVLVDSDGNDAGKFGRSVLKARATLGRAGVALDAPMQVAADPGYFSATDLAFAAKNSALVDALIAEGARPRRKDKDGVPRFGLEDFKRVDGLLVCPAQKPMAGPYDDKGRERWHGQGCATCGLRERCTESTRRTVTIDTEYQQLRDRMRERMAQPGARERYNKRIATIEPIFSALQEDMRFRRVSSLHAEAVRAEILLKVIAYNLNRLLRAKRVRPVRMIASIAASEEKLADG